MARCLLLALLTVGSFSCAARGEEPQPPAGITLGSAVGRTFSPYQTALSRNGKELAYRSGPDTLSIMEPLSGKLLRTVTISEPGIGERLYYAPDSRHLIFHAMQQVRLVDAVSGKILKTIGGTEQFDIYSHEFHWNSDFSLLTDVQQKYDFGFKPKVQVWDGKNLLKLGEFDIAQNGGNRWEAISGDGALIATSGRFHRKENDEEENVTEYVELWDARSLKRKSRIHIGKDAYAIMLGLNADGKYLVVVSENQDGAVIWNAATGEKVATLGRFPGGFGTITFSPDDRLFAIQSVSGDTLVFETATGKKIAERKCQGSVPAGVGFTEEGEIIACYGDRQQVRVCVVNREEQPPPAKSVGHSLPVVLTQFSPDGKTILTVGHDDKVIRWDAATGKLLETIFDESAGFSRFWGSASRFSPDGKYLVVEEGGNLTLYDMEKKAKVAHLRTQNEKYYTRFSRVEFSDDLKKVFARGEGQEKRENDFNIVIVSYAAAWNTSDGSLISEFLDRRRDISEELFARHYGEEKLAPALAKGPEVEIGAAIRDSWASSRNAGPLSMGNQLTLRDRDSKKVLLDEVLPLNNGRGISFSPDGKRVALPLNDNTVRIIDLP